MRATYPSSSSQRALLVRLEGEFSESHQLDTKTAKKVPKGMIGGITQRSDGAFEKVGLAAFKPIQKGTAQCHLFRVWRR